MFKVNLFFGARDRMPLILLAALGLQVGVTQNPHPTYWQQHVSYDINASLDEGTGVLSGVEHLQYLNQSPDTLLTISFHLYLNAFRPGSRWAVADAAERRHRFDRLEDPDYGYNRIHSANVGGAALTPIYPFAPDSTIVRYRLPHALPPGGQVIVDLLFDARPSTLPRRQGRSGRRFDFAQWYPRVVAYDRHGWQEHPLYPGGEFYGDFGQFNVALDVAEDQVIGATGVPICGDPGWERANRTSRPVDYSREAYPNAQSRFNLSGCPRATAPGRKSVVWYAASVHHFAFSMNPEYRYEGGRFGNTAVHVLYQPGDEATWGNGIVVGHTVTTLQWLDELFGPYPWPQMTVLHRIEGGGTEFPMMQMNGSPSLGLNLHEGGHNYLMGILANNEWREGWLDEGFTSFQTAWYFETQDSTGAYEGLERRILDLELDGMAEPVVLPGEDYRDFATYQEMVYRKGQLFLYQLREVVGDAVMRRILRTWYDRWQLRHVDEASFLAVAEEVSGLELGALFAEWLHGTTMIDYEIGQFHRSRLADGRWQTRVEVVRRAPGRFPVEVAVVAGNDTARARVAGNAEREWVTLVTEGRPSRIRLDPRVRSHDWNLVNNEARWGFLGLKGRGARPSWYLDTYFTERGRRDRPVLGVAPTIWFNDAAGLTVGLRSRGNYLGKYNRSLSQLSFGTGAGGDSRGEQGDFRLRYANPTYLRAPGHEQVLEVFREEGRLGAHLSLEQTRREHLGFGPIHTTGLSLDWVATEEVRYLDTGRWDNGGTVEFTLRRRFQDAVGPWTFDLRSSAAVGLMYDKEGPGLQTSERFDGQAYGRFFAEARVGRTIGRDWRAGLRVFGGLLTADSPVLRQRQIFLSGADPYETLSNPFLRSRGSLLAGNDVHYHAPGGAGVRGIAAEVSANAALGATLEFERTLWTSEGFARRVGLAAFGDLAVAREEPTKGPLFNSVTIGDAGVGLRIDHRVGETSFTTRFDLPLFLSHPGLAQDRRPGGNRLGFRYLVSFERPF